MRGRVILITGGTGSFGKAAIEAIVPMGPRKVIVYSRDELKQQKMRQSGYDAPCMRYLIGDVRDRDRLSWAMRDVHIVIHAAAMKQVPACEYNPIEAIKTNILGTKNVLLSAKENVVEVAVLLSSDKACAPLNLYGATKLVGEKLFVHGHVYVGDGATKFCVVRYGNVVGSRGSVIPLFQRQAGEGMLKITHSDMTRFWITLPQAVQFVLSAIERTNGREIFVPKLPAMKIVDLAKAIAPDVPISFTGIRPGEKLHELLIAPGDVRKTVEEEDRFVIFPDESDRGIPNLTKRMQYCSQNPDHWLSPEELRSMI